MIRDELKTKTYFDKEMQSILYWREEDRTTIKEKTYKDEYAKGAVSTGAYEFSLKKIFIMYSKGDEFEVIKESYLEVIEDYFIAFQNNGLYYDMFNPKYQLAKLIQTLSLAVLCEIEGEALEKFLQVAKTAPKLKIVQHFLNYCGAGEEVEEEHKNERGFKHLNIMFETSNEEILKKKLMNKYLKSWYNSDHRVMLKETHDRNETYCGYWAFEVAAFVKIRGLDDSSFRDNVYYPKDMIILDKI